MAGAAQLRIERDGLLRPEVRALLREHLANMHELSPPESVHALDVSGLQSSDVTFWTVWDGSLPMGCGALKERGCHARRSEIDAHILAATPAWSGARDSDAHRRRGKSTWLSTLELK